MVKKSRLKQVLTKLKKEEDDYVQSIVKERDLPEWFRGLSRYQREAVDSLLNSLRDDIQQETSHRVRETLRRIGIDPLVPPSKIKLVMKLSRGNDIAFLWFLMEMYYRSSPGHIGRKYNYSPIEQIIITAIAYLDVLPTMRELHKLLPTQIEAPKPAKPTARKKKSNIQFPYFQKQPRPELYGNKLTSSELPHITQFNDFQAYLNPNYRSMNEKNRWFEHFEIKKNKYMVSGIIQDQIDAVIETANHRKPQENLSICAHHEILKLMNENLKLELMVAKKKACEDYFDTEKHFKTDSHKRVMMRLNSEIKRVENDLKRCEKFHFGKGSKKGLSDCQKHYFGRGSTSKMRCPLVNGKQENLRKNDDNSKYEEPLYNFGFDAPFDRKSKYFKAHTGHAPYKFNYEKIFDAGLCRDFVKDAFAKTLNSDSSGKISREQSSVIHSYCKKTWINEVKEYNEAKKKELAEQKVEGKVTVLTKDVAQQQSTLNLTNTKNINHESELSLIVKHERERRPYIADTYFIHTVLASAFKEMRKNKKYVLATIPHAYKFPILREFVRTRYGMEYSRKQKLAAYVHTKKVFFILRKNALNIRIPQVADMSQKRFVSYGCREYVMKKTNYLKEQYDRSYKECMMHDARIYWAAIRPYQCTKGPPIKTFFAYMPARPNDVYWFKPWKRYEFMPAKIEWDKRMRKQRRERV